MTGKSLKEVLKDHKGLNKDENFNTEGYCKAAKIVTEKTNNLHSQKLGWKLIINKNKRKNIIPDFIVEDVNSGKIVAQIDFERDNSVKMFNSSGRVTYNYITVPEEKERYFEQNIPTFFVKISSDAKWIALLNCNELKNYYVKKVLPREHGKDKIKELRNLLVFNTRDVFQGKRGKEMVVVQDLLLEIYKILNPNGYKITL
jgi:hypothetical protein